MDVDKDVTFADAITCGDVDAVLSQSTIARGGITPISIRGGLR
ncbi:unannotated protein [freshwater metagenome]|uniref:Unannotated protein n=1 Tax=freshwater metagenome TaxID=449393 RepID=A0A6J7PMV2_9ZZZZ